jgi:hypothetical protein
MTIQKRFSVSNKIKQSDFILAHDYSHDQETFENEIKNKIWNWLEITYVDIEQSCIENNLEPYKQEIFSNAVWVCMKKN